MVRLFGAAEAFLEAAGSELEPGRGRVARASPCRSARSQLDEALVASGIDRRTSDVDGAGHRLCPLTSEAHTLPAP